MLAIFGLALRALGDLAQQALRAAVARTEARSRAAARRRGDGKEAGVTYRVWVRSWVVREEVFDDRHSAELFRLKLAASRPALNPSDVAVVPERPPDSSPAAEPAD